MELKPCPLNTEELIKELRRYGLSNGGSLGRHMGIMDTAADRLEELNRRAESENKPLTLEQLRQMDGDTKNHQWVWIEVLKPFDYLEKVSAYYKTHEVGTKDGAMKETFWCGYPGLSFGFDYADYGKTWLAYARKPEQEEK